MTRQLRTLLGKLTAALPVVLRDLAGLGGAAAVTWGVWQVYPPASWIVGGLFLLAGAWRLASVQGE